MTARSPGNAEQASSTVNLKVLLDYHSQRCRGGRGLFSTPEGSQTVFFSEAGLVSFLALD